MTKYIQIICKVTDEPKSGQYQKDAKAYLEKKYPEAEIVTPDEIVEAAKNFHSIDKFTNQQCLSFCIHNMNYCYILSFVDDYEFSIAAHWNMIDSLGAMLEHRIAKQLGIPIELLTKNELYGE